MHSLAVSMITSIISDRDCEFGIVQGDDFHGGDDLAGLLDLSSSNEMEVGLFNKMLHVAL